MTIDKWARFLANEKLTPSRLAPQDTMRLVALCEALAAVRGPLVKPHAAKLESRQFVAETAIAMGLDMTAIRHRGRMAMSRSMLDAWTLVYAQTFGSAYGTAAMKEQRRRNVKTALLRDCP